jgi:sigma-B regulation protein RsbU (phosphoserine phosphatase)
LRIFVYMPLISQGPEEEQRYILFVDDEPAILTSLYRLAREWAEDRGLTIRTAESGSRAQEILEEIGEDVWVMVSDLKMPGMSGAALIEQTRAAFAHIVTMVVTGYADLAQLNRTIHAGIFAYASKPWDNDELLREIDRAYEHARIQRDNARYVRTLETELSWAGELQQKLLEVELPARRDMSVEITYRPLPWLSRGGDYHDVIPFGDDGIIIMVGDVSGHGVRAAFVTAFLKAMIYRGYVRQQLSGGFSPAAFLAWLNQHIIDQFTGISDVVLTFSASFLDVRRRRLITAGAGNETVCVTRAAGDFCVNASGPMIGVARDVSFTDVTTDLEPKDTITCMTDGMYKNHKQGHRLPAETVLRLLREHPFGANDVLVRAFAQALAMPEPADDITMIRVQIR